MSYMSMQKNMLKKMMHFVEAFNRMNLDEYEQLKAELKEELHIKDSFNPFEEAVFQ